MGCLDCARVRRKEPRSWLRPPIPSDKGLAWNFNENDFRTRTLHDAPFFDELRVALQRVRLLPVVQGVPLEGTSTVFVEEFQTLLRLWQQVPVSDLSLKTCGMYQQQIANVASQEQDLEMKQKTSSLLRLKKRVEIKQQWRLLAHIHAITWRKFP